MPAILQYYTRQAYQHGVTMHPQKYVEALGLTVLSYHFHGISDTAWIEVESLPESLVLPPFITVKNNNNNNG